MKSFTYTIALFFIGMFLFQGCKSAGSGGSVSSGAVEATVDGSVWKGSGGTAIQQTVNTGSGSVTAVTVAATKLLNQSSGDNETMEITIYSEVDAENIGERSYDVSEDEIPGAQFSFTTFINGQRVSYFGTSGTVTVKSVSDENVKGSFEGTVTNVADDSDTKEISGGAFNVDFGFSFGM